MEKVNLNLIPGSVLPVINASQYDEGRQFKLALFDGASAYDLTGKTVTILVGKTDGHGCAYDATDQVKGVPVIAVSTNEVTVTTPVQMTAAAGNNMAELQITSATAEIRTLNFILRCEPAALDPSMPVSDTEIPAIERAGWEAVKHYPKPDPVNNHWLVWDVATGQWVDTGVSAGGGGVTDYNDLTSRPQINGVLLTGDRTASALGLATDAAMTGATSGAAGSKGLVPAPAAGDQAKSLRGDGTWQAEVDTLAGLSDTTISSPADGQILKYDADSGKWINSNGGGGGAGALSDLSDVDIDSMTDGEPLTYDSSDNKWINGGIIPTANGGTGNADGFIRTGLVAGVTPGSESTAEGYFNTVTGTRAHAEGYANTASGNSSHAEGSTNTASGNYAHTEGLENTASAYGAHAGGRGNEAGYDYQTVVGKYNKNASDSLFEVGNGTGTALANRSNAIAVKTDGRITKGQSDAFPAASNLATIELTRTMSAQRTAGSYVYVVADDVTYKITATIAASGTLTPGTNATAVNVGAELTALNSAVSTLNSDLANKIQMVKLHTANTITIALTNGTGVIPWSVLDLCDRTKYDYLPMASCNGFFLGLSYRFTGDGFTVAGNDQTYSGNVSLQVFALACAK